MTGSAGLDSTGRKVAAVTGAGSGIGRALAIGLARRGVRLAVSDVDEVGLDATVDRIKEFGSQVHRSTVDVADRGAVREWAGAVREHFGVVHQIYNNAGISGASATVLDGDPRIFDRVLSINLAGVVNGTQAFLPHLVESGAGHVVNISSLNGYMAQPLLAAYCTSKFGVRGFTEALRAEMLVGGHPVDVTVVHPGGVRTNVANAALTEAERLGLEMTEDRRRQVKLYNKVLLRMPAERAADIILRGVERRRARVLVGRDAQTVDALVRALPVGYQRIVARQMRRLTRPR